jgi:hypothetical protein
MKKGGSEDEDIALYSNTRWPKASKKTSKARGSAARHRLEVVTSSVLVAHQGSGGVAAFPKGADSKAEGTNLATALR